MSSVAASPSQLPRAHNGSDAVCAAYLRTLRDLSLAALQRMYDPAARLFCFTLKRGPDGALHRRGLSRRYTAITLLGLAREEPRRVQAILAGETAAGLCERHLRACDEWTNLGDLALLLWAAAALRCEARDPALQRLERLLSDAASPATVEWSWAVSALALNRDLTGAELLLQRAVQRLTRAYIHSSRLFPHQIDASGVRDHVSCFADFVYPTQALAIVAMTTEDRAARSIACEAATAAIARQGVQGQWWWHFDARSGDVLEGYPVYAVHQDAMAPMALLAAEAACQIDTRRAIDLGLQWLRGASELGGRTLVDAQHGVIWRKVARREPSKLTRRLQAAVSRVRPGWRVPGVNALFPPCRIDFECRSYHLGWLLYAFPESRLERWESAVVRADRA